MIHAFLLVLVIGGVIQEEQPMYFRGIETCNWYASKLSKSSIDIFPPSVFINAFILIKSKLHYHYYYTNKNKGCLS